MYCTLHRRVSPYLLYCTKFRNSYTVPYLLCTVQDQWVHWTVVTFMYIGREQYHPIYYIQRSLPYRISMCIGQVWLKSIGQESTTLSIVYSAGTVHLYIMRTAGTVQPILLYTAQKQLTLSIVHCTGTVKSYVVYTVQEQYNPLYCTRTGTLHPSCCTLYKNSSTLSTVHSLGPVPPYLLYTSPEQFPLPTVHVMGKQ
jgi:hypothetical protein